MLAPSAPVLLAPTVLLGEQNRWSAAPTALEQAEPAEQRNRTLDPAAPCDPVLHFGPNRTRPRANDAIGLLLRM